MLGIHHDRDPAAITFDRSNSCDQWFIWLYGYVGIHWQLVGSRRFNTQTLVA
jgi:hypothetical protein